VSSLNFIIKDSPQSNAIAITSSTKNEGKTTTASNIAITMAQSGKKTLLIDADLRSPSLGEVFSLVNNHGLSGYLKGNYNLENIVQSVLIENLEIITTGSILGNPISLFESPNFQKFLEEVKKRYDFVVIDTAPINLVVDTKIIASKVDGTIIVVNENQTRKSDLHELSERLLIADAKIFGFVYKNKSTKGRSYDYTNYY
jgi:capsular exopolysaccharide synthesis family protein